MKTWVKGGLIGAGIYLTLLIMLFILTSVSKEELQTPFNILIIVPCVYFFMGEGVMKCLIIQPVINIIIFFIIGAIIGLIIQKVKNKK